MAQRFLTDPDDGQAEEVDWLIYARHRPCSCIVLVEVASEQAHGHPIKKAAVIAAKGMHV